MKSEVIAVANRIENTNYLDAIVFSGTVKANRDRLVRTLKSEGIGYNRVDSALVNMLGDAYRDNVRGREVAYFDYLDDLVEYTREYISRDEANGLSAA